MSLNWIEVIFFTIKVQFDELFNWYSKTKKQNKKGLFFTIIFCFLFHVKNKSFSTFSCYVNKNKKGKDKSTGNGNLPVIVVGASIVVGGTVVVISVVVGTAGVNELWSINKTT